MPAIKMRGRMNPLRKRGAIILLIVLMGLVPILTLTPFTSATINNSLYLDWTFLGDVKGELLGQVVAYAGDVNGDTYADILIGTPKDNTETGKVGSVRAFFSNAGGLPDQASWTAHSDQSGSLFGQAVSNGGDVNNDGYDDIVIGAPHYKNGDTESAEGRAYIFFGSKDGLSNTPTILEINQQNALFGYSVTGVGDVNSDNYDDILIGARGFSNGEASEGGVFLFLGSSTGIATTASWSFESNQAGAGLGTAVSAAGDVNHDGFDDFLVGAPYMDTLDENAGVVFLFLGDDLGPRDQPDWTITGPHANSLFGMAVAGSGDVNQDGFGDILIGAPQFTNDQENEGGAFLYLGHSSSMNHLPMWKAESNQVGALMGTAVSSAGDVNHDGYPDILVGSPLYSGDQAHEGRVSIYLGCPSGITEFPAWHGFGDKADTLYGQSVSTANYLNSDLYADILVGAPDFRAERDPVGKAFAYLGQDLSIIQYDIYLPVVSSAN